MDGGKISSSIKTRKKRWIIIQSNSDNRGSVHFLFLIWVNGQGFLREQNSHMLLREQLPNQRRTRNQLPTELRCRNFVDKRRLSIQVMQNVQKCKVYNSKWASIFAYHRWWLGGRLCRLLLRSFFPSSTVAVMLCWPWKPLPLSLFPPLPSNQSSFGIPSSTSPSSRQKKRRRRGERVPLVGTVSPCMWRRRRKGRRRHWNRCDIERRGGWFRWVKRGHFGQALWSS